MLGLKTSAASPNGVESFASRTMVRDSERFEDIVHARNLIVDGKRDESVGTINKSSPQVVGDRNTAAYEAEDGDVDAI